MRRLIVLVMLHACVGLLHAQSIQSNGTGGGPWNQASTWVGGIIPTSDNSTAIIILTGDVVTVPNAYSVQVDQMTIQANATLTIASGGVVDIVNGTNGDLTMVDNGVGSRGTLNVFGSLELSHQATTSKVTSTTATVHSGGIFRLKYTNGGAVIGAVWQDGSTLEFTAYTSGYVNPTGLNQSFYNVTFNCPSLTGYKIFSGLTTVRGDFTVESTGTGQLRIFDASSNLTLTVDGNVVINGSASVIFSRTGTNDILNIGGSFLYNSSAASRFTQQGSITVNVQGNFTHTNATGSVRFADYADALATLNLVGDMSLTGHIITAFGGIGDINFMSGTVHSFTTALTLSGTFNFSVPSGNTLDLGTSFLTGSGSFSLASGATLRLGATDANGALQNSTTLGNIRVAAAKRTYSAGSTIVYNGTSAQWLGNGHPNSTSIAVVFDNPASVSLLNAFTAQHVALSRGTLSLGSSNVTVSQLWTVDMGTLSPGTGAVIFSGVSGMTGVGAKSFGDLTVNATGVLTFPAENVSMSGNLSVLAGGTLVTTGSTLVFVGNASQDIGVNDTEFGDILVSKTGGAVTLLNALKLQGTLTMASATVLNSNGFLTLLSRGDKPAIDGSIAALAAGSSVAGQVTAQRYFGIADNYDRFISSPVTGATVAQLQQAFAVTGNFPQTSYPCVGCINDGSSLKWYRESVPGTLTKGYVEFPGTAGSSATLTPGVGYDAYMWNGVAPGVVNFTGAINSGVVNLGIINGSSIGHTNSTPVVPGADGWNLVGNPYPSAIQWNNGAGWSKTNIDPTVWVWDVAGRVWHSYNANTDVGDLASGIIATGQGFWVYAPAQGSASLTVNEQAKSVAGAGSYYRERSAGMMTLSLKHKDLTDNAFIVAHQKATDGFDEGLDAYKLNLGIEDLSVSIRDKNVANLGHYVLSQAPEARVPLSVFGKEAGEYTLTAEVAGQFDLLAGYYLVDTYTHQSVLLSSGVAYSFSMPLAETAVSDRFYLSNSPEVVREEMQELTFSCAPNPFSDRLKIEVNSEDVEAIVLVDQFGAEILAFPFTSENGMTKVDVSLAAYAQGFYFVKVLTRERSVLKKLIKI